MGKESEEGKKTKKIIEKDKRRKGGKERKRVSGKKK